MFGVGIKKNVRVWCMGHSAEKNGRLGLCSVSIRSVLEVWLCLLMTSLWRVEWESLIVRQLTAVGRNWKEKSIKGSRINVAGAADVETCIK